MDNYAIYSYRFVDVPVEGDVFRPDDSDPPADNDDRRRKRLDFLFGKKNTEFAMMKYNKSDADTLPCTVLAHPDHFVLLRMENPKELKYFKKQESQHGEIARIDERRIPSNPYIYVIFDFREGCGDKVAISINSSAWRSCDKVAELIQDNVNRLLQNFSFGFAIVLQPEMMPIDFVSHSRYLVKKKKLSVTKVTFYFTRGKINSEIDEIINSDNFIKGLLQRMYNAQHGELILYGPEGQRIVHGNSKVLSHIVALAGSEPASEPFRFSMSYSDGSTYKCGKDIRMEFRMDEVAFFEMMGIGSLFPEHTIESWFNHVSNEIAERRNAGYSKFDRA